MFFRLLRSVREYKRPAILTLILMVGEAVIETALPYITATYLINRIQEKGAELSLTGDILPVGLLMVGLALVSLICAGLGGFTCARASSGFAKNLRHDIFQKVQTFTFANIDKFSSSSLVTRMTSDINQVQNGVNLTLRLLLRSPFIVIGALIMAFSISPRLTLLFLGVTVAVSLIIWAIMRVTVPIYHEAQNGLDRVTLLTRENYVGARVVRAFARQADELAAFVETNDHLKSLQFAAGRISALMNPLTYLVVNLAVVALLLRGGMEVDAGALTQGEVIALINYMSQILLSLLRLADLVVSVTRALASGMRVNEILNTRTTMEDPGTAPLTVDGAAEAVRFEHVDFTYRGAGAPSLTDISFAAGCGETIGVIGGTGSGKSTLIDLICRFYDADRGTVTLFGHDVKQYSFAQLRSLVGIVPQQAVLFTGTIRDNMQWAAPNATDAEIWEALEIAQAADFVRSKPGMLDAPVETAGRNFSGGQRQRLTIARALVPKPKILILDDSASALDFATDAALRKAIKEKTQGMTVFIVSQRAASVQRADHILVLDDGTLAGDAPHAALLQSCEVYKEICLSQLSKEEVAKTL